MYALMLKHRTAPGRRADVEAIWQRHMQPAIAGNPGHVGYIYSFSEDPDVIVAVQVYRSREDGAAFIASAPYLRYIEESRDMLAHEPEITMLDARWVKGA